MNESDFNLFWKQNKKDLIGLLKNLKKEIGTEYRSSIQDAEDKIPMMDITISVNADLSDWNYQTGDNSFTGSCYGDQYWAVEYLHRRSNCKDLANELIEQLANAIYFEN